MTDWIMIAITAVYVIATIFICIFNYRSAKQHGNSWQNQNVNLKKIIVLLLL